MKGNFWRRIFRKGYGGGHGGTAAHYNGTMAKTDAKTNRAKLKKFLDSIDGTQDQEYGS